MDAGDFLAARRARIDSDQDVVLTNGLKLCGGFVGSAPGATEGDNGQSPLKHSSPFLDGEHTSGVAAQYRGSGGELRRVHGRDFTKWSESVKALAGVGGTGYTDRK